MSFLLDLNFILVWWSLFFAFGVIFLPLTFLLFPKFIDRGYLFSKIIGICITTYFAFLFSTFRIFKFSTLSILLIIIFFLLFNIFIFIKNKNKFISFINSNYKIIIFEELMFFFILLFWSIVRALSPDIESLEKFMDWGFINTILRSEYMPPIDMWYSGSTINYYYFGQLYFALLTKLSNISSAITYNLSMATLCSLTFSLSFSLILNILSQKFIKEKISKIIIYSLIGSWLLTFSGNLHFLYSALRSGFNSFHIQKNISSYWYPDATRFIGHDPITQDKTIHEFPLYSFIVSDLHGHVNDIPIVILFLAVCFSFILMKKEKVNLIFIFISSLILSWVYMTNAWDFAIYGLFFGVLLLLTTKNIKKTFIYGTLVLILWYIWSLPFSMNFSPMAQGVALFDSKSPFYQLFILYGGFWILIIPSLILKRKYDNITIFNLSLIIIATLLVIIPEFVYVKDIYAHDYRRANTMFKLVYQAFILYSISIPFCLLSINTYLKKNIYKKVYNLIFIIVFISHSSYLFFALPGYYFYKTTPVYKGLYGMNFLKTNLPDNFNAINWINQNIEGQPVLLEASGDSYTLFNNVSSSTGLPTPIGWLVHEWLWRNGYEAPAARQEDVKKIYTTKEFSEFKNLVSKYNISYIIIGTKEFEKYQQINYLNFEKANAKIVFESGFTKIYHLTL